MRSPSPVRSLFAHAAQIASAATVAAARSAIGTRGIADVVGRVGARDRARERLVVHVVAGQRGEVAGLPVAAHRAVDDRRVHRLHVLVADAEPVGDAGPPALAEHVGARRELERARAASSVRRSSTTLPLCDATSRKMSGNVRIGSWPRRLELQHVGAEIGEQLRRVRHRPPDAGVEHAHPVEQAASSAHCDHPVGAQSRAASSSSQPASSRSTASVLVPSSSAGGRSTRPANDDRQRRAEDTRSAGRPARRDGAAR